MVYEQLYAHVNVNTTVGVVSSFVPFRKMLYYPFPSNLLKNLPVTSKFSVVKEARHAVIGKLRMWPYYKSHSF